jgi:hypothetical protein
MATMHGYKHVNSDQGLGLGGNPRLNERPDQLNDSIDNSSDNVEFKADKTFGMDEITIEPRKPQMAAMPDLTVQDFLNMMEKGDTNE